MRYLSGDVGKDITLQHVVDIVESGETELMLTTNGGSFFEALAIRDYLKKTNQIQSIGCLGMVASAGTLIMQGVKDRWAAPASKFLIHGVQGGMQGSANDLQLVADELRKLSNEEASNYAMISGKPIEEIQKIMDEERILTADEALSLNLINRITTFENAMKNEKDDFKFFSAFAKKMKSLIFTNLVVQSTDGTELDFGDEVESLEQIVVGVPCSQNGSFVLTDGKQITVEGNKVTAVTEATTGEPNAELEQMKAENERLKAELEASNLKVTELTNKQTEFLTLKAEFETFKNQFSQEEPIKVAVPKTEEAISRIKITRK